MSDPQLLFVNRTFIVTIFVLVDTWVGKNFFFSFHLYNPQFWACKSAIIGLMKNCCVRKWK